MKKITYSISLAILLTGCNEVNSAKLNYQAQSCTADNSVSCNDIRVRRAVLATKIAYQQMIPMKKISFYPNLDRLDMNSYLV